MSEKHEATISHILLFVAVIIFLLHYNELINADMIWVKLIHTVLLVGFTRSIFQGMRYQASYELDPNKKPFSMMQNGPEWTSFLKRRWFMWLIYIAFFIEIFEIIWFDK